MNGAAGPSDGDPPAADDDESPIVRIDRAGPGGGVPSDSAFGVAMVTLWQRVADAGGLVGFTPPVARVDVAARAAGLVDDIRTGRLVAVAANRTHRLIGLALLRPGSGSRLGTGRIELLLVDPAHTRAGIGRRLLNELLRLARERGLGRLDLDAADTAGTNAFFEAFGFVEWGRRPEWIRIGDPQGPGSDDPVADGRTGAERDEIIWGVVL